MRLPAVVDATVRSLVLTLVGALLLAVVPGEAFGASPAWRFLGQPGPTVANLFGIGVIAVAWVYFAIVVLGLHGVHGLDATGRVALIFDLVAVVTFVIAAIMRWDAVALVALGVASVSQILLAVRINRRAVRFQPTGEEVPARLR